MQRKTVILRFSAGLALALLLAACGGAEEATGTPPPPEAATTAAPAATDAPAPTTEPTAEPTAEATAEPTAEATAEPTADDGPAVGGEIVPANAAALAERARIETGLDSVVGLAWSAADVLALATASGPYLIDLALAPDYNPVSLQETASPAARVAFSSDGTLLLVEPLEQEDSVELWDVSDVNEPSLAGLEAINEQLAGTRSAAFSDDGLLLATGNTDGTATVWDTSTWQPVAVFDPTPALLEAEILTAENAPQPAYRVTFSPDASEISIETTGAVVVFDRETGDVQQIFSPMGLFAGPVASARWFPAGDRLAWISRATVVILDAETQAEVTRMNLEDFLMSDAVTANGEVFITAAGATIDGGMVPAVELWDASSGERLGGYPFDKFVSGMAVSPDGSRLAVAAGTEIVILGTP